MVSNDSKAPIFEAFGMQDGEIVAIVGSGGKATLMYQLAAETVIKGLTVVTTSTTHLHPPTSNQTGGLYVTSELSDWPTLVKGDLKQKRHITVLGSRPRPDKFKGLSAKELKRLREVSNPDITLIKADGARTRLFKAPSHNEPVIASGTTLGVIVVSLRSIGLTLDSRYVHRPEMVSLFSGIELNSLITPQVIAKVVSHPKAYLDSFPQSVPLLLYLSCANDKESHKWAGQIVNEIPKLVFSGIYAGDIKSSTAKVIKLA